jgi:hypothetical protein
MASSLVVDSKELEKQVELRLGHTDASDKKGAILFTDPVFVSFDELIDFVLLGLRQICQRSSRGVSVIVSPCQSHVANLQHGWEQTAIAVSGKDRLGEVSTILFVKALPKLDSSQSPLISVQLEVGNNPRGLSFLPVREVKENLLLP